MFKKSLPKFGDRQTWDIQSLIFIDAIHWQDFYQGLAIAKRGGNLKSGLANA